MTLALFAALFSSDAEAAKVVVKPVPVVVATPHVQVQVGRPVVVAKPRPVVVVGPPPPKVRSCAS